jgi:hypothetical protein
MDSGCRCGKCYSPVIAEVKEVACFNRACGFGKIAEINIYREYADARVYAARLNRRIDGSLEAVRVSEI